MHASELKINPCNSNSGTTSEISEKGLFDCLGIIFTADP